MKEMRRVLALVLCFVMLVGYVPVGALATETEPTVAVETQPVEEVVEAAFGETISASEEKADSNPAETTAPTEETEVVEEIIEAVFGEEITAFKPAVTPVETEPVETEPVETEPVETEPVETEPAEVLEEVEASEEAEDAQVTEAQLNAALTEVKNYIAAMMNANDPSKVVGSFGTHFTWDNEKRESGKPYFYEWSYYNGVVFEGLEYLYEVTGETQYRDYVLEYMSSMINEDGSWTVTSNNKDKTAAGYVNTHGVDGYKTASLLLDAYAMTGDSRYLKVAELLYADLDEAAENYSLPNAGNNYHHTWASPSSPALWLDGVYMTLPFRAEYASYIGDQAELDLIVDRLQWISDNMYNEDNGLFYHAADSAKSNSDTHWLRSMGWYAAAMVDVMDYMDGENLKTMKTQLKKMVDGMADEQIDGNGMWLNDMKKDYNATTNPYEPSGTALVAYAIMKAVNKGWLDAETYAAMATDAFVAICENKLVNNVLKDVCLKGAPKNANSTFADNEGKGVGPFIMLYSEVKKFRGEIGSPEINTVTYECENDDIITATGMALIGVKAQWNDTDLSEVLNPEAYSAYDVTITGPVGERVAVTLDTAYVDAEAGIVLYIIGEDGALTEVTDFGVEGYEADGVPNVKVSFAAPGNTFSFALGNPIIDDTIPEDAVLTDLSLEFAEDFKYAYLTTEIAADGSMSLDLFGMGVTAEYNSGEYTKHVFWNQFDEEYDGYAVTFEDLTTPGVKKVKVTYGGMTRTFRVTVCEPELKLNRDMDVQFTKPGVTDLNVTMGEVTKMIETILADRLTGQLVAYDFTPEYAKGYDALEGKASITLPIPEGITRPAVYYVSDLGETEKMPTVNNGDGTMTFTTTHFSKFVVGEDTSIDVADPNVGTVTGTTGETITAYVLVDTMELDSGYDYLIVNRNTAGNGYALGQSTSGVSVNVRNADSSIPLPHIIVDNSALEWNYKTVSGQSALQNAGNTGNNRYLYYDYWNGLSISANAYSWTVGTNSLATGYGWPLVCDGSSWTVNYYGGGNVYFYREITFAPSVDGTYTIDGTPASVERVLAAGTTGQTVTLNSELTRVYQDEVTNPEIDASRITYSIATGKNGEDGDPNEVITSINGSTVNLSGKHGTALVKVSYTVPNTNVTVYNYIEVTARAPYYEIPVYAVTAKTENNTTSYTRGADPIETLAVKGVKADTVRFLSADLMHITASGSVAETGNLTWTVMDDPNGILDASAFTFGSTTAASVTAAAGEASNVALNFSGKNGSAIIRIQAANGTFTEITVTASDKEYYTPSDGTNDFPDYPEPGSVVIDKTATAVGDFNETGITQVELSMFGVPSTVSEPVDVVLVVDLSNSMNNYSRKEFAEAASNAFVDGLAANPENRLAIVTFNDENATYGNTVFSMSELTAAKVQEAKTAIDGFTDVNQSGTNYVAGLKSADEIFTSTKDADRKQFMVFLSDGEPGVYRALDAADGNYEDRTGGWGYTPASWVSGDARNASYKYEHYTTHMKADQNITVYTVALGISNTEPKFILNDMSGPAGEKNADNDKANAKTKLDKYYFEVGDADDAGALSDVFSNIAKDIAAASNVQVKDLIAPNYSLIFELPEGIIKDVGGEAYDPTNGQEFYLEVINYALDANHDRTGDAESLLRLYLNDRNAAYTVVTEVEKILDDTPVTTPPVTTERPGQNGVVTITTTVYDGTYRTVTTETLTPYTGEYSVSGSGNSLKITTPYFTYDASAEQTLQWSTDALGEKNQIALRYFVYLNGSAGSVGDDNQLPPGVYQTNTQATVTYTNHLGNPCQQTFPVPQMTWNGAQMGYNFYLVNEHGQPINRAGRVVPLAAAYFVTDIFYESVVWNTDLVDPLRANVLAREKLPEGFELYDPTAEYMIHVYKDEEGNIYDDFFEITGSMPVKAKNEHGQMEETDTVSTYVYNTINGIKYNKTGVYSGTIAAGQSVTYKDQSDNTNKTKDVTYNTGKAIDYSSTMVSFAVRWVPKLTEDTVVVDYGLPVMINVLYNDQVDSVINNLGHALNSGTNEEQTINSVPLTSSPLNTSNYSNGVLTLENGDKVTKVEGQLKYEQADMEFKDPVSFYYDTKVSFEKASAETATPAPGYMYSKVTVVPATTVYYEDSFLTLASFSIAKNYRGYKQAMDDQNRPLENVDVNGCPVDENGKRTSDTPVEAYEKTVNVDYAVDIWNKKIDGVDKYGYSKDAEATWTTEGTPQNDVFQATDRPGADKIGKEGYDADNIYGYDEAYDNSSTYSLGTARKIHIQPGKYGTAKFSFWGTGFDVMSMTSNLTGVLTTKVYKIDGDTKTQIDSKSVDTYYGYDYGEYYLTYVYAVDYYKDESGKTVQDYNWRMVDASKTGTVTAEKLTDYSKLSLDEKKTHSGETAVVKEMYWMQTNDTNQGLYQVPVIKMDIKDTKGNLVYGHYEVELKASYFKDLDHTPTENEDGSADGYDLYLDAVRIYNPAGVDYGAYEEDSKPESTIDKDIQDAYIADGEGWPEYFELRNKLIAARSFGTLADGTPGAVFIDQRTPVFNTDDKTWVPAYSIADYISYGPNNEVYLAPGQGVVFTLNLDATVADVQIGLKYAKGMIDADGKSNAKVTITTTYTGDENKTVNGSTAQIPSGSDRYYSIKNYVDLDGSTTVAFTNTGAAGTVISITNVKITHKPAEVAKKTDPIEVNKEETNAVLRMLNAAGEAEPEVKLDADLDVSVRKTSVKVGASVVVKVTTSADVDYLMVNGEKITKFSQNRQTGKRSWTASVKAEEVGDLEIKVTAYSTKGAELDADTQTVEVTEAKASLAKNVVDTIISKLFR